MRLAVLPIDSRPCNTQFVHELVRWAGAECVLPPAQAMDDFHRPAPYAMTRQFLETELSLCDAAVISLDHWCFGGLLASRDDKVTTEEALFRVADLTVLLRAHPDVPVYMSSIIMRSSISTLSFRDLDAYYAMTEYSVASDRFERFALPEDREKAENARKRIPTDVLDKVFRVRRRNLQVNLAAVDLAAEGLVRSVSLLQEDSQLFGLHKKDQRVLLDRINQTGTDRVYLRNGADEAGCVSALEALWAGRTPLPVQILFLGAEDFVAPFEDRPFQENMESACRELGLVRSESSPVVICVCCPPKADAPEQPVSPAVLNAYAQRVSALLEENRQVYLLDLTRANGGSRELIRSVKDPDRLCGYSAWNTASNSMGTLLAQVLSDTLHGRSNRAFYCERLLDDLIYQETLRPEVQKLLSDLGEDVFSLKDKPRAESLLRSLYDRELPGLWPLKTIPRYTVSLPWSRTFEVRADVLPEEEDCT